MLTKWSITRSSDSSQRGRSFRPLLETLEDRLTPSSTFIGSLDTAPLLTPSEVGAVGTMIAISANTGFTTGNFATATQMIQQTLLAVDDFLLSQPAIAVNPGLSAALTNDANLLSAALNAGLASGSTGQASGPTFNMTMMGLMAAQANPVTP